MLSEPLRLLLIPFLLIAITVHEFSHALVAHFLGDSTARSQGRLTINPLAHLDVLGTIMIIVTAIYGVGIGWGKPVPVNPHSLRYGPRNGMALVALAGPVSNILLATALLLLIRHDFFGASGPFASLQAWRVAPLELAVILVATNVGLAVFNMIPVIPLDGSRVLAAVLPARLAHQLQRYAAYGPPILLGAIVTEQVFDIPIISRVLWPAVALVGNGLAGIVGLPHFFRF